MDPNSDRECTDNECIENEAKANNNSQLHNLTFGKIKRMQSKMKDMQNNMQNVKHIKQNQPVIQGKKNKNRRCPEEKPSNKQYSTYMSKLYVQRRRKSLETLRDPRFNDHPAGNGKRASGELYSFINELRDKEAKKLQNDINIVKDNDTQQDIKLQLSRMESQNVLRTKRAEEAKFKKELTNNEASNILKTGKKCYYYSKSKIRRMLREKKEQEGMQKPSKKFAKAVARKAKRMKKKEASWLSLRRKQ